MAKKPEGVRKKWAFSSADREVDSNPGPKPPYQELTITAAKNRGKRVGWSRHHSSWVKSIANTTVNIETL